MNFSMRCYALRDDQWNQIKNILPARQDSVGVTSQENRLFVTAFKNMVNES